MGVHYYFTATALPPLVFGTPPELNFGQVMQLLKVNLSGSDWQAVETIRRYYDVQNVRAFLRGQPRDERGSLSAFELEEALYGVNGAPSYFARFYSSYDSDEKRLRYFAQLLALYFQQEIEKSAPLFGESFLHRYLQFERSWRLVAVAMRAKQQGRDLLEELQFEPADDPLVAQLIVQKEAQQIEPPEGFASLKSLFQTETNPLAQEQSLCLWRFDAIEEMLSCDLFSIGRILGYVAQLIALEKWLALDKRYGLQKVDSALKEVV